jgi:HKD family nuclease
VSDKVRLGKLKIFIYEYTPQSTNCKFQTLLTRLQAVPEMHGKILTTSNWFHVEVRKNTYLKNSIKKRHLIFEVGTIFLNCFYSSTLSHNLVGKISAHFKNTHLYRVSQNSRIKLKSAFSLMVNEGKKCLEKYSGCNSFLVMN